jgi:hypothetical protein
MKKSITILSILLMFIVKINCQNVGISDNTSFVPLSMLHIQPSASYAGDLFSVQNSAGLYAIHATLGCKIGFGTNNPNSQVDIVGGVTGVQNNLLTIRSNFTSNNTATGIRLINSTSRTSNVGSEIVSNLITAANGRNDLIFNVHGGGGAYGALLERMRICGSGNVGIGITAPTEKLDVVGNVKFSGALMPNNLAGTSGNILTSSGAGIAPKWSTFTIGNPGATTIIAKYYSSLSWTDYWYSGTIMTFTITDSDCRNQSCISVAIDGPWNTLYSGIVICNVVCENGQFRITAINQSGFDLAGGIPISFIAFY